MRGLGLALLAAPLPGVQALTPVLACNHTRTPGVHPAMAIVAVNVPNGADPQPVILCRECGICVILAVEALYADPEPADEMNARARVEKRHNDGKREHRLSRTARTRRVRK